MIFKSTLIIILLISISANAFQNEPTGFRGISWGTDISKLENMKLSTPGNTPSYEKIGEKFKIGDADLENVYYITYKNKLFMIQIPFKYLFSFSRIKNTFFEQYGAVEKAQIFPEKYIWTGKNIHISLDYNEITEEGSIFYIYQPIFKLKDKADKEKAKKAASDL
ncbi:MAG: hypothetical protein PHW04_04850 [Candidatus Wallbacteria bacterium]|nr:hypothetical protein [Candidatus Wallbacteria bacterium]